MPSIGPQLPPHLLKRKRTPEDDEDDDRPRPPPIGRAPRGPANKDEIALNADGSGSDDDDDVVGSSLPSTCVSNASSSVTAPRPRGPAPRPPSPSREIVSNPEEITLEDGENDPSGSDEDDVGPVPPTSTTSGPRAKTIGPALPPPSQPLSKKRIIGPAAPPPGPSGYPSIRDSGPAPASDSDSGSDDYGPVLPPSTGTNSSRRGGTLAGDDATETSPLHAPPSEAESTASKRDAWMLAPPTTTDRRAPDPTRMRSRGFASGRSVAGATPSSGGVGSLWTETPEQKAQRLADAVLGRAGDGAVTGTATREAPAGEERRRNDRVGGGRERERGPSLYEEHQARRRENAAGGKDGRAKMEGRLAEEDDDPSKRAFDREKDMGLGSRVSNTQRRQLLNRSANFGDRFEKGTYLRQQ